jgi:PAS domain-containing protein
MKITNKTKKELVSEVETLRARVSELERSEKVCRQALRHFGERRSRHFPQNKPGEEAIFVVFGRKLEFINNRFAELFSLSPEEACSDDFNLMTLIEQESRTLVRQVYKEGARGAYTTTQFEFTGLSRTGVQIECEAIVIFIPYKWGTAMQGMLRNISVQKQVDDARKWQNRNLRIVSNSIPASGVYADSSLNAL